MVKKLLITFAALALVGACVLGAGAIAQPGVAPLPVPIEESSPCPATGCASGTCHEMCIRDRPAPADAPRPSLLRQYLAAGCVRPFPADVS